MPNNKTIQQKVVRKMIRRLLELHHAYQDTRAVYMPCICHEQIKHACCTFGLDKIQHEKLEPVAKTKRTADPQRL